MPLFTFIGVPIDSVGRAGGTEHGPEALRELALPAALGGPDGGDLAVRIRGEERDAETGILGLVNFDGHADLYDGETSPTGEAADMPALAALFASPGLIGASFGCYNPEKDPGSACGRRLVESLAAAGLRTARRTGR